MNKFSLCITLAFSLPLYAWDVHGIDDRVSVDFTNPISKNIGQLANGCTATAVGGPYLLTAAHCADATSTFCLNRTYGSCPPNNSYAVKPVRIGPNENPNDPQLGADYAILRADRNIKTPGDVINVAPLADHKKNLKVGTKVTAIGYPVMRNNNGQHPVMEKTCEITRIAMSHLETTCDATGGNSGGPLLYCANGNCQIIGVISRSGKVNTIASATDFSEFEYEKFLPGGLKVSSLNPLELHRLPAVAGHERTGSSTLPRHSSSYPKNDHRDVPYSSPSYDSSNSHSSNESNPRRYRPSDIRSTYEADRRLAEEKEEFLKAFEKALKKELERGYRSR